MLFFLLCLYGVLFFAGHFSPKDHRPPSSGEERAFTASELKQKEETARNNLAARPGLAAALSAFFLFFLGAGIGLDFYFLMRTFRGHSWKPSVSERAVPRWGMKDVMQALVFLFFVEGAIFIVQTFWYWATGLEKTQHDLVLLGNSLLRDLCVAAFVFLLVRLRGQSLRDLGFRGERFWKNVKTGVIGYVAVVPPMLLGFVILGALMQLFSYEPMPQEVVQIYLKKSAGPYLFIFTMFVAILGPVLEELFFRGFAYPVVKRKIGSVRAMALTAAVFAGFHMSLAAFAPIFFLGFFLTYLYETTGSLVPSITAHVLHNTLMVFLTLGFRSLAGAG